MSSEIVSGEACPYSARYAHIRSNFLHNHNIMRPSGPRDAECLNFYCVTKPVVSIIGNYTSTSAIC